MNLETFVEYLVDLAKLQTLMDEAGVDIHNGTIYLENKLDLDSQVQLIPEEETDDLLEIVVNGTKYIQLFPLHMAIHLASDYLQAEKLTSRQLAEKLLHYAIFDA